MGRGYTVEESVEKYLASLSAAAGSCETGLLIGQSSAQKDFVVLAVKTPHRESEGGSDSRRVSSPLDDIDADWVAEHARQVSRMLPGGVNVLGLFLITPPELSKEAQNTLKRLIFAVDKCISKSRLWDLSEDDVTDRVTLHICSKTRKAICKTYDVKDPKCSAKPADWKYLSGISSSWPVLTCSVKVDLQIPVTESSSEKCIKDGLRRWAKQIEGGLCLINGRPASDDSELLSGSKKSTKTSQQQTLQAQILVSEEDPVQRCSAVVQASSGSVRVRGTIHCRAYSHTNKPRIRHAAQAIKRDVVNTVSDRVEMLLEDLQMNEEGPASEQQDLPQRVFAPLPGSGLTVCDYMFPDETATDVAERLKEMLDWESAEEDIDTSVEAPACRSASVLEADDGRDDGAAQDVPTESNTEPVKQQKASHYYAGVAVAAAVALLATATSLLYLNE
ncbi:protein odr-4 homolog [Colossoma macropomum]|uniref:protein odr-4 homolog n=1 Tax=Colossoma macropomum TaxID=42526 RepID=UPI00186510DF|nr:protein odr-4 homolog [Colossoma macropomum]